MEAMDLLLLLPVAIFAVVNAVASIFIVREGDGTRAQRTGRLLFIWLVPILGAVVCLAGLSERTRGLSSRGRSRVRGAAATGHGASGGDAGGTGGGDGGACDGGAAGC